MDCIPVGSRITQVRPSSPYTLSVIAPGLCPDCLNPLHSELILASGRLIHPLNRLGFSYVLTPDSVLFMALEKENTRSRNKTIQSKSAQMILMVKQVCETAPLCQPPLSASPAPEAWNPSGAGGVLLPIFPYAWLHSIVTQIEGGSRAGSPGLSKGALIQSVHAHSTKPCWQASSSSALRSC